MPRFSRNDKLFRLVGNNKIIGVACCALLFISACAPTKPPQPLPPIGQIPQLSPVTPADEKFGQELLAQLAEKYQLDFNHPRRSEVDEVVQKLTESIGGANHPWHVNVFADSTVKNAAATRGNNIFIWTGMIDATQNRNELSAVLAHEIGHILAHHTEPTSGDVFREMMVGIGSMAAGTAVGILTNGAMGADIAQQVASSLTKELGSGLLIYPYTREKETEADEIGLFLMKKAGFPPQAAIDFWTRAEGDPAFSASLTFFSTHPPAADRLEHLRRLLPIVNNPGTGQVSLPVAIPTPNPQPIKSPSPSGGTLSGGDSFDIRK